MNGSNTAVDHGLLDELTTRVGEQLKTLRDRIDSVRRADQSIEIIAVTKGFGAEAPLAAMRNGLTMLGENYADELVAKAKLVQLSEDLAPGRSPRWTFQGRLQTNKINRLIPFVDVWQSVDTKDRLDALAKRQPAANVCIQVRLTEDLDRSGAEPAETAPLVEHARSIGLQVLGLMGVGPDPELADSDASRRAFRMLNELCETVGVGWRSMGMSSDFEQAILEGATHIRIGTALFGDR
jgi:PLP dependent protein